MNSTVKYDFVWDVASDIMEYLFFHSKKSLLKTTLLKATVGTDKPNDTNLYNIATKLIFNKNELLNKLKNEANKILNMVEDFDEFFNTQYYQVIDDTLEEYKELEGDNVTEDDIPKSMLQQNFVQQAGWNAQDKFPLIYKMFKVDDITFSEWEVKGTFLPDARENIQDIYNTFKNNINKIYNNMLNNTHGAITEVFDEF